MTLIPTRRLFVISLHAWPCFTCNEIPEELCQSELRCPDCGRTPESRVLDVKRLDKLLCRATSTLKNREIARPVLAFHPHARKTDED